MSLPRTGHVLGIDVGYSEKRATTGLCRLWWTADAVRWECRNAAPATEDRQRKISALVGDDTEPILAVAIDGPLRPGLRFEATYRCCESLLSRGTFQRRGKPGQSSSTVGRRLHYEATKLAELALQVCNIGAATWQPRIHDQAVAEAFPNLFLGFLCDEATYPAKPSKKRKWTDELFPRVRGTCERLLTDLLPCRQIQGDFDLKNHEHVAGLVCAMTALVAAANDGVLVGSASDGDIVLPPRHFWGKDRQDAGAWAASTLKKNLSGVRGLFPMARILNLATGKTIE